MAWLILCGSLTTLHAQDVGDRRYFRLGIGIDFPSDDGSDQLRKARSPHLVDTNSNTFGDKDSIDLTQGMNLFLDVLIEQRFSLGVRYMAASDKRTTSWGKDRRVDLMGVSVREAEYREQVLVISRYATGTFWIPLSEREGAAIGFVGGLGLVTYDYRQSVAKPGEDQTLLCAILASLCMDDPYDTLAMDSAQVKGASYLAGAFFEMGRLIGVRAGADLMLSDLPTLKADRPQGGSRKERVAAPSFNIYLSLRFRL